MINGSFQFFFSGIEFLLARIQLAFRGLQLFTSRFELFPCAVQLFLTCGEFFFIGRNQFGTVVKLFPSVIELLLCLIKLLLSFLNALGVSFSYFRVSDRRAFLCQPAQTGKHFGRKRIVFPSDHTHGVRFVISDQRLRKAAIECFGIEGVLCDNNITAAAGKGFLCVVICMDKASGDPEGGVAEIRCGLAAHRANLNGISYTQPHFFHNFQFERTVGGADRHTTLTYLRQTDSLWCGNHRDRKIACFSEQLGGSLINAFGFADPFHIPDRLNVILRHKHGGGDFGVPEGKPVHIIRCVTDERIG